MKVTVIGKEHVSCTSKKTGKPFSATVVHVHYIKSPHLLDIISHCLANGVLFRL